MRSENAQWLLINADVVHDFSLEIVVLLMEHQVEKCTHSQLVLKAVRVQCWHECLMTQEMSTAEISSRLDPLALGLMSGYFSNVTNLQTEHSLPHYFESI